MTESLEASVVRRLQPAPFWDFVGAELIEAGPGRAIVRIPRRPEYGRSGAAGSWSAHGGMVATAIDMAASCAVITTLSDSEGRATIDLAVHYLAPAEDDLVATATVRRRGGRVAVIDVELASGGQLVALGRLTFAITRQGQASG
ncbi:MAG: PaaI family thioesterase [Dehalococcoidia bacterium]